MLCLSKLIAVVSKLYLFGRSYKVLLFKTNDVNVSLKFQTYISEMCQYFLLKKFVKLSQRKNFFNFFTTKNIIVFGNKVVKLLTS